MSTSSPSGTRIGVILAAVVTTLYIFALSGLIHIGRAALHTILLELQQSGAELPQIANHLDLLGSPLIVGAIILLLLPLLAGATYLLRLSRRNQALSVQYEETLSQTALLQEQNQRLQDELDKRVASEQQLTHQANYDQLTGLPNRNLALDRLAQATKWAKRDGRGVLVMFLDLDRFKQVNDTLGHAVGDELLREAAQRLQSSVRESDTVSRLGGDEFLII